MPAEPLALSTVPPESRAETDYDAICTAVTATARGRWFLDEYAKRNRHSDTLQVLAAIARMEAAVVGDRAQQASRQAHQEVRIELLEMARAIAQARAEVAESRPAPSQHRDAVAVGAPLTPDIAAAAERLRQIAWTMRACGIDLPASDQIGQIADAILSADALMSLGDQRAHKLTEALHYLEHRIERMLDSRLAAAADDAKPAAEPPPPQMNGHSHDAVREAVTAAVTFADDAATVEAEAEKESPPPFTAEVATAAAAADTADATELPLADDVLLMVADNAVEREPDPLPPTDFAVQELWVARVELEIEPLMPAAIPPADAAESTFEHQAIATSFETAGSDAGDKTEAGFSGLDIAPLAVVAETEAESHPVAIAETPDEPALAGASAIDDLAAAPRAEMPPVEMAFAGPIAEPELVAPELVAPDLVAPDLVAPDLGAPELVAPDLGAPELVAPDLVAPDLGAPDLDTAAVDLLEQPPGGSAAPSAHPGESRTSGILLSSDWISGGETEPDQPDVAAAATAHAEPADATPPVAAAKYDAIAMQVEQDLDGLTDAAPDGGIRDTAAVLEPPAYAPVSTAYEDDPTDLLLDTPQVTVPPPALAASAQVANAQISNALAAIEIELFADTAPPATHTNPPVSAAMASSRTKLPPIDGPLAVLMAMSEEERIALFS